jgi:hypothetical protein
MTDREIQVAMTELMQQWNKHRALWIERFGNDEGFAQWFTSQVKQDECRLRVA